MENKNAVVLLPSYQPEETLVYLAKGLKEQGFLVVIVDDGSGDKFTSVFNECEKYGEVVSYVPNRGKGFALRTGYSYILEKHPETICTITADGDGQHNIKDIIRTYERCKELNISIIGVRRFDVKTPLKSKMGNGLSKFTQAFATYRYMKDNQCGLRAFPTSILPQMINIRGNRYEYEMKVLSYLLLKEIKFQCINIQTIYEEGNKTSHFRAFQDTVRIQSTLLKANLIPIGTFCLQILLTWIINNYVFDNMSLSLILSLILTAGISLVLKVCLKLIIYKPKHFGYSLLRHTMYEIALLIGEIVSFIVFYGMFQVPFVAVFIISFILCLLPLYYLIKGVGIVYDAQINDEY